MDCLVQLQLPWTQPRVFQWSRFPLGTPWEITIAHSQWLLLHTRHCHKQFTCIFAYFSQLPYEISSRSFPILPIQKLILREICYLAENQQWVEMYSPDLKPNKPAPEAVLLTSTVLPQTTICLGFKGRKNSYQGFILKTKAKCRVFFGISTHWTLFSTFFISVTT